MPNDINAAWAKVNVADFRDFTTRLKEARDNNEHKAEFDSFDAYCRNRWCLSASLANQLIDLAEAIPEDDKEKK